MRHRRWDWGFRLISGLLLPLVLAGCMSIQLVSNYDAEIDSGLSRMNTETTAFVDRMIAARGTPAGTYTANTDFYIDQIAALDTLMVRAEAHRVLGRCPAPELVGRVLEQSRQRLDARRNTPGLDLQTTSALDRARSQLETLADDDCEVGLLRLIRMNLQELRQFHIDQGELGIPPSARGPLLEGGLGSTIRSALTVEIAKKGVTTSSGAD